MKRALPLLAFASTLGISGMIDATAVQAFGDRHHRDGGERVVLTKKVVNRPHTELRHETVEKTYTGKRHTLVRGEETVSRKETVYDTKVVKKTVPVKTRELVWKEETYKRPETVLVSKTVNKQYSVREHNWVAETKTVQRPRLVRTSHVVSRKETVYDLKRVTTAHTVTERPRVSLLHHRDRRGDCRCSHHVAQPVKRVVHRTELVRVPRTVVRNETVHGIKTVMEPVKVTERRLVTSTKTVTRPETVYERKTVEKTYARRVPVWVEKAGSRVVEQHVRTPRTVTRTYKRPTLKLVEVPYSYKRREIVWKRVTVNRPTVVYERSVVKVAAPKPAPAKHAPHPKG